LLFGKLPDEIFKPLAGPNRYLFEEVLLFLFRYFSDEDLAYEAAFPRRAMVKDEIEELLARKGRLLYIVQEEDGDEPVKDSPGIAAEYMYRRLVQTGWLEEEADGYNTNVIMPPHSSLLLEALEGVAHAEKKNYGSTIASINVQLEAITNHPETHGRAFIEVVRAARDFTRHLQNIFSGLRGFQEIITRQHSPKLALSTFFDDFVETLLISDYKSLQAENNPFRHRTNILSLLQYIEYTPVTMEILSKVYQEDKNLSPSLAMDKLVNDIHFIARIFRSVDRRLDAIDLYRMRLESRVAEMVRYMDRNVPDMTNRGISLLNALGQMSDDSPEGELHSLPQPTRWLTVGLLGHRSVRKPHKRRQPFYGELAEDEEISAEKKEQERLNKIYLQRRAMTPAKVGAFIVKQMGEKKAMAAKDFKIETIEDLVAFSFVPFLGSMKGKPMPNMPAITVQRTGERFDCDLLECSDFIIEIKG